MLKITFMASLLAEIFRALFKGSVHGIVGAYIGSYLLIIRGWDEWSCAVVMGVPAALMVLAERRRTLNRRHRLSLGASDAQETRA